MRNNNLCVYAGSFDPPTQGHMFMIREGSRLFRRLIAAVGTNADKRYTFSIDERVEMLCASTKEFDNVEIDHFEGRFLVDYAKSVGANYILRGIRSNQDYEFEHAMRNINGDINPDIMSVFMMPPREICEVSSSFVKGLVGPQGWQEVIRPYVPPPVYEKLLASPVRWHRQSGGHETAAE